jgi:hypothetical protein
MTATPEVAGPTALYRIYGDADLLLYIGISDDFGRRWRQHAKKQPWWPERRWMTVDWYDSRAEAEDAETAAIKAEGPVHNIVHAVPQPADWAHPVRAPRPERRVVPMPLGPLPVPLDELLALPTAVDLETAARALGLPPEQACMLAGSGRFPVRVMRYGRIQNWSVSRASIFRELDLDPAMVAEPPPAERPAA